MDEHILETLEILRVRVRVVDDLPDDRDGEYLHRRRIIRLRAGMARRLHRSVLAHECAHAVFADEPTMFGPRNALQERRADEWAALRLIDIDDYKLAERMHDGHAEAIAVDLDVTVDIVDAFRRILQRFGDTVYVRPRMGAGQWDHLEEVQV
ncbi:ImmA/IrrE family metallo-endopeptidase [Microbacterium sp. SORGH_AS_0862]|uniref:ImmA/IrrE family metallo-endopeptidase n=1 Tax=Microbacterium sp. SORGH_AS_0862 TaxID=3041789 RepID=UPI00278E5E43|nr:ImmA/IrrE family metallo-endopeptidase [Microbacterium sp. SORGH_AS_0862]MDQ1206172.1 hypothetical protein [Microbacterium sp. SORGH_AS_0862]